MTTIDLVTPPVELALTGPATEAEIEAMLAGFGLPAERLAYWVGLLPSFGLSITELRDIVVKSEPRRAPWRDRMGRALQKRRLTLRRWVAHQSGVLRLVYAVSWVSLLANSTLAAIQKRPWFGVPALLILGVKARAVMQELSPKHMHLFERNYPQYRMKAHALVARIQEWALQPPLPREIESFQIDALKLIASYVRDHRVDLSGTKIYANLIVEHGDALVVIRRSDPIRPVPIAYPPQLCSIAARAFREGMHQVVGDLYAEHPESLPNKPYHAVVAIPVKFQGRVLAVVSLDSEVRYHFSDAADTLPVLVGPYVQLLASSLMPSSLPSGTNGVAA